MLFIQFQPAMKLKGKSRSRISNYQYLEEEKSWKWTKGKVAAISLFGLLVLGLIFSEVILFKPYEVPTDNSNDALQEYRSVKDQQDWSYLLEEIDEDNTLEEVDVASIPDLPDVTVEENENIGGGNQGPAPSTSANRPTPSREIAERPELRISDNGEIVEVANVNKNKPGNQPPGETVESTNSTIEEEFYTEVAVTGTITSASDSRPIAGVVITVKRTAITTATDANGKYAIIVPGNPEYRMLSFSYRGNISERRVQPDTRVINLRF